MRLRFQAHPGLNVSTRFNGEAVMLLAALLAVAWLRLALPAINFGQSMPRAMNPARAMTSMTMASMSHTHEMADSAALTHSQTTSDPCCQETMPGCDTYLQGLCPFTPVFVVSDFATFTAPVMAQAAPPSLSADDRSPLGRAPKIPPRP